MFRSIYAVIAIKYFFQCIIVRKVSRERYSTSPKGSCEQCMKKQQHVFRPYIYELLLVKMTWYCKMPGLWVDGYSLRTDGADIVFMRAVRDR